MTTEPNSIDDELLSAYLDNELAPEERARVDERLAADPAARNLLKQLRAVSRAVKDLPAAPLGADIRDAVLRKAERAMLTSNPGGSAATGGNLNDPASPPFTIGRSVRGWVWAGLATAAALAIMAFESNSSRDDKLPETVAERRIESTDRIATNSEPNVNARFESASPSDAAPAMTPPPITVAAPAERPADELSIHGGANKELAQRETRGVMGGAAGAVDDKSSAAPTEPSSSDGTNADLLVVRLQVKPQAFDEGAFDGVLVRNGISFEDAPEELAVANVDNDGEKARAARPLSQMPARTNEPVAQNTETAAGAQFGALKASTAAAQGTDVVLVEAPEKQIRSCLEEINKNDRDFVAVSVGDEQPEPKDSNADSKRESNSASVQPRRRAAVARPAARGQQRFLFLGRPKPGRFGSQLAARPGRGAAGAIPGPRQGAGAAFPAEWPGRADEIAIADGSQSTIERRQRACHATRFQCRASIKFQRQLALERSGAERALVEKAGPASDDTRQVLFILSSGDQPATPPPVGTKAAK